MMRSAPGAAALLLLALGACNGGDAAGNNAATDEVVTTGTAEDRSDTSDIVTVRTDGTILDASATPMNEREAVIGLLNKRNGQAREFKMKPGQAVRIDNVVVRLRACDRTAPWENDQLTGAFIQLDVEQLDKTWRRVFSGWLYKERPALNVVQHPIYDVWPKSCAMTFKDSGPDTVTAPSASGGGTSSGGKKEPAKEDDAGPAEVTPSVPTGNAT